MKSRLLQIHSVQPSRQWFMPHQQPAHGGDIRVSPDPMVCDVGIGDIIERINITTVGGLFPATHGDVQGDVANGELDIGEIIACINSVTVSPSDTPGGYTELASCP